MYKNSNTCQAIHMEKRVKLTCLLFSVLFFVTLFTAPVFAATSQEAAVATADASVEKIYEKSINNNGIDEANSGVQHHDGSIVMSKGDTTNQTTKANP